MRTLLVLLALLAIPVTARGEDTVAIPWETFETLYRDRVEKEVLNRMPKPAPEKQPQVHSIDEAHYTLDVDGDSARGEVALSGRIASGGPEPIPLFGADVILTSIESVSGGSVMCAEDERHMVFLPDGEAGAFEVLLRFLVQPSEDERSRVVSFAIPRALRNSLDLTLPSGARVVESPGIDDGSGLFHFSATPSLSVRYLDKRGVEAATATVIEIDSLSRVAVQKKRLLITTRFVPVRTLPDTLTLVAPEGAVLVGSSLRASAVKPAGAGHYELQLTQDDAKGFAVDLALEALTDDGEVSFALPRIEGNTGQQGRFVLQEPDDGQVLVTGEGLVSQIPVARLGEVLGRDTWNHSFYRRISGEEPIRLSISRFKSVSTPRTVLETLSFFSSFEGNGNIFSMFVMDVPPEVGARMELKAIPDAEIWSLEVNGVERQVYAGETGSWIIPLDTGQVSHVELAFLRTGPSLKPSDRLEVFVPESGLASREIRIGVALPPQLELRSVEGPVNAAPGQAWKVPDAIVGKQHFFSRSFYKGEGMTLAVWYQESTGKGQ